jgi:type 1 fimbria pilin
MLDRKNNQHLIAWIFSCLMSLFSVSANAWDQPHDNCSTAELPTRLGFQAKSWSALPIGSVIPGSDNSTSLHIQCSSKSDADTGCEGGGGWSLAGRGFSINATQFANTYTYAGLNDGIGFQFLGSDGTPVPILYQGATAVFIISPDTPVDGLQAVTLRYRLIKIKPVVAEGTTMTPNFSVGCQHAEWANNNETSSYISYGANITRVTSTCVPVVSNTSVILPAVSRTSFNGVGSVARRTAFNLGFQCDPNAHAVVALTDGSTPGTTGSVVTLNTGSTAKGIGVQLLSDGVPIEMTPNELFSVGGTHLTLDSEPGASQVINLPLAVEYVQSAAPITSGTVEASVLVNIAYQ